MVQPVFSWDTADDLIEEYSGFGVRVESRRLGTDRLGFFFEWSTSDPDWREPTLLALALNPQIPGAYDNRMSVTPLLKFAFLPQLSVAGGVGITELEPFADDLPLPVANGERGDRLDQVPAAVGSFVEEAGSRSGGRVDAAEGHHVA